MVEIFSTVDNMIYLCIIIANIIIVGHEISTRYLTRRRLQKHHVPRAEKQRSWLRSSLSPEERADLLAFAGEIR